MNTKTNRIPAFDPSRPWLVSSGYIVDGEDLRVFSQHCCERAAEDQAAYLSRRAGAHITVTQQRPVPRKGMAGSWKVDPGAAPKHVCDLVPVASIEDWSACAG